MTPTPKPTDIPPLGSTVHARPGSPLHSGRVVAWDIEEQTVAVRVSPNIRWEGSFEEFRRQWEVRP